MIAVDFFTVETISLQRVGCAKSGSRGEAVFVNEAAEAVAALDPG